MQFNEQTEIVPETSKTSNRMKPPTFTTPAGTMDTRDYYVIDLSSIKASSANIKSSTIYSKKGGVRITLSENDLKSRDTIKVRKFKDQYFVVIRSGTSEKISMLVENSSGNLSL